LVVGVELLEMEVLMGREGQHCHVPFDGFRLRNAYEGMSSGSEIGSDPGDNNGPRRRELGKGDFGGGGCCWGDVGRRRGVGKIEFVSFERRFGLRGGGSLLVRYAISWGAFNLYRLIPSVRVCAAGAGTLFGRG
jgi:hypothetical protein